MVESNEPVIICFLSSDRNIAVTLLECSSLDLKTAPNLPVLATTGTMYKLNGSATAKATWRVTFALDYFFVVGGIMTDDSTLIYPDFNMEKYDILF